MQVIEKTDRIAKLMARFGACSRREAEKLILEGRVTYQGKTLTSPAFCLRPQDMGDVKIDGTKLQTQSPPLIRLWRFHKPSGVLTTHQDTHKRPTVFDLLPPEMPRVISVGRLDLNTEGLLLLTNHGGLARFLELPSTGWKRRYRVRVFGDLKEAFLKEIGQGITVEGISYGPIEATLDQAEPEKDKRQNKWVTLTLKEGKNREIRKVMAHGGLRVSRLIRLSYGPFVLGNLGRGKLEEVSTQNVKGFLGKAWDEIQT